jgi:hypothetical protein
MRRSVSVKDVLLSAMAPMEKVLDTLPRSVMLGMRAGLTCHMCLPKPSFMRIVVIMTSMRRHICGRGKSFS